MYRRITHLRILDTAIWNHLRSVNMGGCWGGSCRQPVLLRWPQDPILARSDPLRRQARLHLPVPPALKQLKHDPPPSGLRTRFLWTRWGRSSVTVCPDAPWTQ